MKYSDIKTTELLHFLPFPPLYYRSKIFPSKLSWPLQKNSRYREKPYQTSRKTHRRQPYRKKAKKRR